MEIVANGINDAWLQVTKALFEDGKETGPRGHKTKEIKNMSVEIKNPKKRILSLPIRKISLPFAFGELVWYLSARNDVEMMSYYSKRMKTFSDDGLTLNSAYGHRIFGYNKHIPFNQWNFVVDKLKEDPESRQAIMHLHTPNNKPTKDEVCTLSLQFLIRDGKLDMITNMRSNDIVWGFTYDVFSFTTFQELIANELGIEVGTYYHNAASMHIYEKDFGYSKYMEIYDAMLYSTQYDTEFDYEGLTLTNDDMTSLLGLESAYRTTQTWVPNEWIPDNKAIKTMADTFQLYRIFKAYGKDKVVEHLKYDNIYHCIMRNFIIKEETDLIIIDGCDGAGKSTIIKDLCKETKYNTIAFEKPIDFDKQIYFHTAMLSGPHILDRFMYSEVIYSRVFNRTPKILHDDVKNLEEMLNFVSAAYVFVDTNPSTCFERLDEGDRDTFSKEQIEKICVSYEFLYHASGIVAKYRYSKLDFDFEIKELT